MRFYKNIKDEDSMKCQQLKVSLAEFEKKLVVELLQNNVLVLLDLLQRVMFRSQSLSMKLLLFNFLKQSDLNELI